MDRGQFTHWRLAKPRNDVLLNDPPTPCGRAGGDATINIGFEPMAKILRHRHFRGLDVTAFIALAEKAGQFLLRFSAPALITASDAETEPHARAAVSVPVRAIAIAIAGTVAEPHARAAVSVPVRAIAIAIAGTVAEPHARAAVSVPVRAIAVQSVPVMVAAILHALA
jgi:hypothetical protein